MTEFITFVKKSILVIIPLPPFNFSNELIIDANHPLHLLLLKQIVFCTYFLDILQVLGYLTCSDCPARLAVDSNNSTKKAT